MNTNTQGTKQNIQECSDERVVPHGITDPASPHSFTEYAFVLSVEHVFRAIDLLFRHVKSSIQVWRDPNSSPLKLLSVTGEYYLEWAQREWAWFEASGSC